MLDTAMAAIHQVPSSSLGTLIIGCLALYAVWTLGTWAYNLWLHPLRHVPGPWYTAISPAYLSLKEIQFQKTVYIHELLTKYGGIARIGPNMVAFVDEKAARVVYSKFPKSTFYVAFRTNDMDNGMSIPDNGPHAIIKRARAPHYHPNHILLWKPEIDEFTNALMDKMRKYYTHIEGQQKPFDCLVLFRRLMVDIAFVTLYGKRIESVKQWDVIGFKTDPAEAIVRSIKLWIFHNILKSVVPRPVWAIFAALPIAAIKPMMNSEATVRDYVSRAMDEVLQNDPVFGRAATVEDADDYHGERLSLIQRLLRQSHTAKAEDRLSDRLILAESMAHTIAGVDTSATAISYMLYVLALYPEVLARVREEIDPVMPGEEGERQIPDFSVLTKLPYFNAFYMECLRLYASVPAALERVVDHDGEFLLKGHRIPAGTIVATQVWSVHRDPDVFPDPETFMPERWLDASEEMRLTFMTFGPGTRPCPGQNLAQITLRVAVAAIARSFDIVIPAETTPQSMKPLTVFSLIPASGKVPLVFKPRAD